MKLSIRQLADVLATYVDENKISVASFVETRDNTVGLLDTIGKIFTIVTNYVDKLERFNGEDLSFGKTVEEWASDLILVEDYRPNGGEALSPHYSTYRPVYFSYTLGRKVIPQTIKYNDIERAVHNEGQFISIIEDKTRKMYDSETMFRYGMKRQALGVLATLCDSIMDSSNADYTITNASATWATISSGVKGEVNDVVYVNVSGGTTNGIYGLVKPVAADSTLVLATLLSGGYLIKYDLVTEIAKPIDTTTGDAFVKQVKKDVEIASDFSEGHSLNNNTLGVTPENGLVLIMRQGLLPSLEVDVQAGAFHQDKVSLPAEIIVLPDLGNADDDIYALLIDERIMRCYRSYQAVRENQNGDGDFLNYFFHTESTVHISRNCFVKVYKVPQA